MIQACNQQLMFPCFAEKLVNEQTLSVLLTQTTTATDAIHVSMDITWCVHTAAVTPAVALLPAATFAQAD